MRPMVRIAFNLQLGEAAGHFEIAVPQAFFEPASAGAKPEGPAVTAPAAADLERNLELLGEATVELEVRLQGPTLPFEELMELKAGQVLTFDYSLETPLEAWVNGAVPVPGYVVSAGRKRAFQIEEPL
jgi:flagellar motor switch protein FliM